MGPIVIRPGTTVTLSQTPHVGILLSQFIVPRWAPFFQIEEIRVARVSAFLTANSIAGCAFHENGKASRIVENMRCEVGQSLHVGVTFLEKNGCMLSCRVRDGATLPKSWRDINHHMFRLLHPKNPRHIYEIGIFYRFDAPTLIPDWVEARIDVRTDDTWPIEYLPNPELHDGMLESICFSAFFLGVADRY